MTTSWLRSRAARAVLVGTASLGVYFALDGLVADLFWHATIAALLVMAAWGAWRMPNARGAWLWIVGGHAAFLAGDVGWMWMDHVAQSDQYPNIGDVFYVSGYVLIAIGLAILVRSQRPRRDVGSVIDALIVGLGAAVVLWVLFIGPAALDGSAGFAERIVNTAYPAGDLLLIAMGAQLAVRVHRSRAAWLLAIALGLLLAADLWYAYLAAADEYASGHPVDALWWMSYVVIAALVLDPRVGELTRTIQEPAGRRLTITRIVVLAAVTLGAPVTIAARTTTDSALDLPVLIGGTIVLFVLVVARLVVVTRELERSRERLLHDATHDALTGLGNRALYGDRVTEALRPRPDTPHRVAVLCIDLDDFKTVNDSLGHAAGDRMLQTIGARLRDVVRRGDSVARLGGDEFAVLVCDQPAEGALEIADRMLTTIREPVDVGSGVTVQTGASIGIAYGDDGATVDSLLRDADVAMYIAKEHGKNRWEVYRPGMRQRVVDRFELRSDLEGALERDEFVLHYQPIVSVETGQVTGIEALVRWEHPTRGRVDPGRFIGLAEETGLIVPLGRWILLAACRQAMVLDPAAGGPSVAVNLSAVQLRSPELVEDVAGALRESGLAPGRLLLELTESTVIHDLEVAAARLSAIRALGVRVALDDFGAGYTSLRQLQTLPVDVLKLDPSFVADVDVHAGVLAGLVAMAASLGLDTVGEGIEQDDQLERLRSSRCGYAQGYLFARPVPADELPSLIAALGTPTHV